MDLACKGLFFSLIRFFLIKMLFGRRFPGGGGGQVLGLIFTGYVLLASQSPYPFIAYSVASYRPRLSHLWANT